MKVLSEDGHVSCNKEGIAIYDGKSTQWSMIFTVLLQFLYDNFVYVCKGHIKKLIIVQKNTLV